MKVYVMRHGQTVWNEKGITQGRSNNRLSRQGKMQVERVAEKFKNCHFDVIFASPLTRTIQTANIMNKFHNVKIVKDSRLIEVDQGIFTGRVWKTLSQEEKDLKAVRSKSCGMESDAEVFSRIEDFSRTLKGEKSVLVVTHKVCATTLANILAEKSGDLRGESECNKFDNAEVKLFEI